jgi:HK97 family phage major capsid protein
MARTQSEINDLVATRKPVERTFTMDPARRRTAEGDDVETFEFAFSSETPVHQYFGLEILDHSPGACNLERLNSGGALLVCHDRYDQVGVVEEARIDKDKMGRADIRFSKSVRGQEIRQDVVDRVRRNCSVRYIVDEMVLESANKNGPDTYRVTKWTPVEISIEPIPADITVGEGRTAAELTPQILPITKPAASEEPTPRTNSHTTTQERTAMEPTTTTTPAAAIIPNPEVARVADIVAIGEMVGDTEFARELALEGKTLVEARTAILAKRRAAQAATVPPAETPATVAARTESGAARVQVVQRYQSLKAFKGDGAAERAFRFGQWFLAGPCGRFAENNSLVARAKTYAREHGLQMERAHTESVNEDGGFTVPAEFSNDFIDLREQYGVIRRHSKVEPMSSETKIVPRRTGGLTFYPAGETVAATESKKGWDQVTLVARKWLCLAKVSSELREDSVVNMADDLANEMAYAASQLEDNFGFNGDGTSTYHGIRGIRNKILGLSATRANIAGLVVGAGNLWSELVLTDFEKVVALLPQYADTNNAKWFCHKTFYWNVMAKLILASGGVTGSEVEGARTKRFLGYDVEVSQVLPRVEANDHVPALFGDLRMGTKLGNRRDLTIALSEHSSFDQDELDIRGSIRNDFIAHDVGNASGTADDRVPGPIVGILTAAS